jgi:hypothetical protein
VKIYLDNEYFKFELEDGECTYQGHANNIIKAKELFLKSLSDKIDQKINSMLTNYCYIKEQIK